MRMHVCERVFMHHQTPYWCGPRSPWLVGEEEEEEEGRRETVRILTIAWVPALPNQPQE